MNVRIWSYLSLGACCLVSSPLSTQISDYSLHSIRNRQSSIHLSSLLVSVDTRLPTSALTDQDILWLDIPVHNMLLMEIRQGISHLSDILLHQLDFYPSQLTYPTTLLLVEFPTFRHLLV